MKDREQLIKETEYLVEGSSFRCWQQYCYYHKNIPEQEWKQGRGWVERVGSLDGRPVCIMTDYETILGVVVMFWEPCSEVVDHKQIEEWFQRTFPGVQSTNETNFHHAAQYIREKHDNLSRSRNKVRASTGQTGG